jgi:hypothetical protein
MAALAEDYPDFPASFVLSRKGTPLLMDDHNHKYSARIYIDPVFMKTSPKRSFSVIQNERFGLVFVNFGHRIHSNNTDKTIATYRCIQRNALKCPATANLKISTGRNVKFGHSHAPTAQAC